MEPIVIFPNAGVFRLQYLQVNTTLKLAKDSEKHIRTGNLDDTLKWLRRYFEDIEQPEPRPYHP